LIRHKLVCLALFSLSVGFLPRARAQQENQAQQPPKDATQITAEGNAAVLQRLPFNDRKDYEEASRGFIAAIPGGEIKLPNGRDAWNLNSYDFLKGQKAPATVNPSLWRMAQLNMNNGLFKVVDRIYQLRGFDLSNITIIEGDTGVIVIDPLITKETAKVAMDLYFANRPKKPVVAVIYTHSHIDHYGGVKGVVSEEDVKSGKTKIYAPEGFLREAVSENVYAGNAMTRRAQYQYGALLPRSPKGQLDAGLGKTTSFGEPTLIQPTDSIKTTGETKTIDGVEFVFLMASDTEAPAEMLFYLPQFKAMAAAEDLTHTLHNLYTLRGAKVRDAVAWWKAINNIIDMFGDKTEVVFSQHHWPKWGNAEIVEYMKKQRDQFKYIHDQTLHLANQGYTMNEIAEMIKLPESLAKEWYNRGYYGSLNHDSKAVYQRYLGYYDSNPAHLYPLPPVEAGKKYVEFMGGADAVIAKAKTEFAKGEYRFVAEVLSHVVMADPSNQVARNLEADALEQLGYQTENSTWRNEFLQGASELRNGPPKTTTFTASPDVGALTGDMIFDFLGISLNGPKAAGKASTFNFKLTGEGDYAVSLENGVLVYSSGKQLEKADVTLEIPKKLLVAILFRVTTLQKEIEAGHAHLQGNQAKLVELFGLFDSFSPNFNIVTSNTSQ